MTETVITFTTAQLWGWVLAICGSVIQTLIKEVYL